eukprot:scaffold10271_cov79-Skeletonema_marinoi.AAC.1
MAMTSESLAMRTVPVPITPRVHRDTVRKEVDRLVDIDVLEPVQDSEWGSPSFIIAKSNGTVRFLTDFRELNKRILRRPQMCSRRR